MSERPTKKQRELLSFIDGFIKGNGYSPSYREVMRALDYKSVSTVATHVNGLIARGWLVKKDNSARSLTVVMPTTDDGTSGLHLSIQGSSAEAEILTKIEQLKSVSLERYAREISTLEQTLEILGYTAAKKPRLV